MAGQRFAARARALTARLRGRPDGRLDGEEGFTLIELLIVLVIIPMVIGAIAVIMITTLKATVPNDFHGNANDLQGTSQRLAESHDTQITSAFFVRDVQSSLELETNSSPVCGTGTQLLGLTWNVGATAIEVSYVKTTVDSVPAVVRNFCSGSSPVSKSTVSHNMSGTTPPTTTLSCNTSVDLANACSTDANSGLISTVRINTVEIDVTETSGYVYKLIASPRRFTGNSKYITAAAPTLLLADGGNCGNGNLSVNGTIAVNYSTLTFGPQGGASASQVYQGETTFNDGVLTSGSPTVTSNSGPFNSNEIGESISGTGIPSGTTVKSVQSSNSATMSKNATSSESGDSITIGPTTAVSPAPSGATTTNGPTISDPYANLPTPSPSGADTYVESSLFEPSTSTLTPGIYIIEAGMKLTGNTPLTLGATLADGTNGVFFYVTGGSVTIGGTASITLSAISAGPYASIYGGILLYQVSSDTSPMVLDGSSAATTLNGAIAAPGATVTLNGGGNGAGLTALGLEANQLNCNGNNTTIGLGPSENTSTVVTSSSNPSTSGQQVTFTATVSGSPLTPTGTVSFTDTPSGGSATAISGCTTLPLTAGTATCQTSLTTGSYTITASYTPTAGSTFGSSSGTLTQTVGNGTSTTLTSSLNPSGPGQTVTYTATVTPSPNVGTPTGSVTFKDGASTISCGAGSQTFNGTTATCTVTYSSSGTHTMTAVYSGDSTYGGSTSNTVTQTVTKAMHISALISSGNVNGGNWKATATITVVDSNNQPVSGVVVTGSWTTLGNGGKSGCTTNSSGTCSFTTGNLSGTSDTWTVTSGTGLALSGYTWQSSLDAAESTTANP